MRRQRSMAGKSPVCKIARFLIAILLETSELLAPREGLYMQGFKRGILGTDLKSIPKLSAEAVAITQGVHIRNHPLNKLLLCPTNSRFEPEPAPESLYQGTRKSWQDKAEHTNFQYVSIWTAGFDTVFGQSLPLKVFIRGLRLFTHIFNLGSMESLIPSPKRLYASTVTNMARPGNTEIHHAISILSLPMVSIFPQLAVGGCMPIPQAQPRECRGQQR